MGRDFARGISAIPKEIILRPVTFYPGGTSFYEELWLDVIVPQAWFPKEEWPARTPRPKLHRLLPEYLLAVRLNDRYFLDGREANGYAGVAWAIAGKHDRPWGPERSIFGLMRYLPSAAAYRQFDAPSYIRHWGE